MRSSSTSTMPILLTTAAFLITGVLSVAAAVSFTFPSVWHFVASSVPIVYDNTVFLLKPPYLYIVINCIIVSIVATSKLTHKSSSVDESGISGVVMPVHDDAAYLNVASAFVEDVSKVAQLIPEAKVDDKQPETEKPTPKNDSPEISIPKRSRKPPRSLKTNPQGGGVTKPPRKQDTLETTWKKITEGRSTPLTNHLTKSDTWQERTQHVHTKREKMTKSAPPRRHEKTPLNREPSPGQEELNRRVEAFINKFNEDMRLQRLESLAKYNELVNRGTRL